MCYVVITAGVRRHQPSLRPEPRSGRCAATIISRSRAQASCSLVLLAITIEAPRRPLRRMLAVTRGAGCGRTRVPAHRGSQLLCAGPSPRTSHRHPPALRASARRMMATRPRRGDGATRRFERGGLAAGRSRGQRARGAHERHRRGGGNGWRGIRRAHAWRRRGLSAR